MTDNDIITLLTSHQAAKYLHLRPRTLANWRVLGRGPKYVRVGRHPLYRQTDLDAYLDTQTCDPTDKLSIF